MRVEIDDADVPDLDHGHAQRPYPGAPCRDLRNLEAWLQKQQRRPLFLWERLACRLQTERLATTPDQFDARTDQFLDELGVRDARSRDDCVMRACNLLEQWRVDVIIALERWTPPEGSKPQ